MLSLIHQFDVLLLCINHNCYLYMLSCDPDLVNKLISIIISILRCMCIFVNIDDGTKKVSCMLELLKEDIAHPFEIESCVQTCK